MNIRVSYSKAKDNFVLIIEDTDTPLTAEGIESIFKELITSLKQEPDWNGNTDTQIPTTQCGAV